MQFFVAFAEDFFPSPYANSSFTVRTGDLHNAIPLRIYAIIVVHIILFIKIATSICKNQKYRYKQSIKKEKKKRDEVILFLL